jgi:hypothetical protein
MVTSTFTLFGKARRAVLSLLYGRPDIAFYLREIVRDTGVGVGPVQRELKQLNDAGIIQRTAHGRQVYYQANHTSPFFPEIKSLVSKTSMSGGDAGNKNIVVPRAKIDGFCRRHHIRRLSLFGSVLRDDFGPDSDVDVLVEFESGSIPGFFGLFDMEAELSSLLGGHKVDMRTERDISRYFRTRVVKEAKAIYEESG